MLLKLGDLEIYVYDAKDPLQRHLKYTLENDEAFQKYVTKRLEERLKESQEKGDTLQFNTSYLVKYKEEFVGYIRLEELKRDGSLNIECAVAKEFRNQSIGKKILDAITKYILYNIKEVTKVKGVIEKSNYASRKMAESVGYVEDAKDDFYVYVSKSR